MSPPTELGRRCQGDPAGCARTPVRFFQLVRTGAVHAFCHAHGPDVRVWKTPGMKGSTWNSITEEEFLILQVLDT